MGTLLLDSFINEMHSLCYIAKDCSVRRATRENKYNSVLSYLYL